MKRTKIVSTFGLLLAVASINAQQLATRKYNVGDIDRYDVVVRADTSHGELLQSSKLTQKVVKVYENGEADIESSTSDVKASLGGISAMIGDGKISTAIARFNKHGVPVVSGDVQGVNTIYASQYALLGIESVKDIVLGKEFPIDEKKTGGSVKGRSKIVSIDGSTVNVLSNFTVTTAANQEPMKLRATSVLDYSNSRILKFELEVLTGLPKVSAFELNNFKITMTRLN
jgi:hypothetical protein